MTKTNTLKWKAIKSATEAEQLIDMGVMLTWRDFQALKKVFPKEEEGAVIKHLALRLCERHDNRLSFEIVLETLLVWLANAGEEGKMQLFLEELFAQSTWLQGCWQFVECGLTAEVSENDHDEEIFSMAVVLTCEIGLSIREGVAVGDIGMDEVKGLLDHITTYLLSVSNSNSTSIRLSLLHYFGVAEQTTRNKTSFNRIMSRFGHTVLDNLFMLLFDKKSEGVALQYLQENLPFILCADNHCQRVLHETSKHYMLKHPERFALFVQTFAEHLHSIGGEDGQTARSMFAQHLGLLFKVASDVNHKQLGRDLLAGLSKFDASSGRDMIIQQYSDQAGMIRKSFRELVLQVQQAVASNKAIDSVSELKSNKRGRKPSFSRVDRVATIQQVAYLAQQELAKAS